MQPNHNDPNNQRPVREPDPQRVERLIDSDDDSANQPDMFRPLGNAAPRTIIHIRDDEEHDPVLRRRQIRVSDNSANSTSNLQERNLQQLRESSRGSSVDANNRGMGMNNAGQGQGYLQQRQVQVQGQAQGQNQVNMFAPVQQQLNFPPQRQQQAQLQQQQPPLQNRQQVNQQQQVPPQVILNQQPPLQDQNAVFQQLGQLRQQLQPQQPISQIPVMNRNADQLIPADQIRILRLQQNPNTQFEVIPQQHPRNSQSHQISNPQDFAILFQFPGEEFKEGSNAAKLNNLAQLNVLKSGRLPKKHRQGVPVIQPDPFDYLIYRQTFKATFTVDLSHPESSDEVEFIRKIFDSFKRQGQPQRYQGDMDVLIQQCIKHLSIAFGPKKEFHMSTHKHLFITCEVVEYRSLLPLEAKILSGVNNQARIFLQKQYRTLHPELDVMEVQYEDAAAPLRFAVYRGDIIDQYLAQDQGRMTDRTRQAFFQFYDELVDFLFDQQRNCPKKPQRNFQNQVQNFNFEMQKIVYTNAISLFKNFCYFMQLLPRSAMRKASHFFDFMISNLASGSALGDKSAEAVSFFKMLKMGYKQKNLAGYSVVIATIEFLLITAESTFYSPEPPQKLPIQTVIYPLPTIPVEEFQNLPEQDQKLMHFLEQSQTIKKHDLVGLSQIQKHDQEEFYKIRNAMGQLYLKLSKENLDTSLVLFLTRDNANAFFDIYRVPSLTKERGRQPPVIQNVIEGTVVIIEPLTETMSYLNLSIGSVHFPYDQRFSRHKSIMTNDKVLCEFLAGHGLQDELEKKRFSNIMCQINFCLRRFGSQPFVITTPTADAKQLIQMLKFFAKQQIVALPTSVCEAVKAKMMYKLIKTEANLSLRRLLPGIKDRITPELVQAFEAMNALRQQLFVQARFVSSTPHLLTIRFVITCLNLEFHLDHFDPNLLEANERFARPLIINDNCNGLLINDRDVQAQLRWSNQQGDDDDVEFLPEGDSEEEKRAEREYKERVKKRLGPKKIFEPLNGDRVRGWVKVQVLNEDGTHKKYEMKAYIKIKDGYVEVPEQTKDKEMFFFENEIEDWDAASDACDGDTPPDQAQHFDYSKVKKREPAQSVADLEALHRGLQNHHNKRFCARNAPETVSGLIDDLMDVQRIQQEMEQMEKSVVKSGGTKDQVEQAVNSVPVLRLNQTGQNRQYQYQQQLQQQQLQQQPQVRAQQRQQQQQQKLVGSGGLPLPNTNVMTGPTAFNNSVRGLSGMNATQEVQIDTFQDDAMLEDLYNLMLQEFWRIAAPGYTDRELQSSTAPRNSAPLFLEFPMFEEDWRLRFFGYRAYTMAVRDMGLSMGTLYQLVRRVLTSYAQNLGIKVHQIPFRLQAQDVPEQQNKEGSHESEEEDADGEWGDVLAQCLQYEANLNQQEDADSSAPQNNPSAQSNQDPNKDNSAGEKDGEKEEVLGWLNGWGTQSYRDREEQKKDGKK